MSPIDYDVFNSVKERMGEKFPVLLDCYLEDGQKYLNAIKDNLPGGNINVIIESAHSLKSASGILGAVQVCENAGKLEYAAKDLLADNTSNFEELRPLYKAIKNAFVQASSIILPE